MQVLGLTISVVPEYMMQQAVGSSIGLQDTPDPSIHSNVPLLLHPIHAGNIQELQVNAIHPNLLDRIEYEILMKVSQS